MGYHLPKEYNHCSKKKTNFIKRRFCHRQGSLSFQKDHKIWNFEHQSLKIKSSKSKGKGKKNVNEDIRFSIHIFNQVRSDQIRIPGHRPSSGYFMDLLGRSSLDSFIVQHGVGYALLTKTENLKERFERLSFPTIDAKTKDAVIRYRPQLCRF